MTACSLGSQRDGGIDTHRPACWSETAEQRGSQKNGRSEDERNRVSSVNAKEQRLEEPGEKERRADTDRDPDHDQTEPFTQDEADQIRRSRPEREAQAHFVDALRD